MHIYFKILIIRLYILYIPNIYVNFCIGYRLPFNS